VLPPAPPLELLLVALLLVALELLAVVPPPLMHCPSWQTSPLGQRTPSQGQFLHAPVTRSQQELSVHGLGSHLSATQAGGLFVRSQV
jgi:hypothetical protein